MHGYLRRFVRGLVSTLLAFTPAFIGQVAVSLGAWDGAMDLLDVFTLPLLALSTYGISSVFMRRAQRNRLGPFVAWSVTAWCGGRAWLQALKLDTAPWPFYASCFTGAIAGYALSRFWNVQEETGSRELWPGAQEPLELNSLVNGAGGRPDAARAAARAAAAAAADEAEQERNPRPGTGRARVHISRLLLLAKDEWRFVLAGCIALFIRLPFSLAIPHFVSEGIDAVIEHGSNDPEVKDGAFDHLVRAVCMLAGCGTVDAILDFWNFFLFVVVQQRVVKSVKLRLFGNILRQEMAFFDAESSGDLMSRITADTVQMSSDISFVFRFTIEAVVRIGGVGLYMFVASWKLAIVAFTIIPINSAFNKFYGAWLRENATRSQDALAESNGMAHQAISGIRTVRSFAAGTQEFAKYKDSVENYYELQIVQGVVTSGYYMIVSTFLMNMAAQAAILSYGGFLAWNGRIEVQQLVAFMLYREQLQSWVNNLLNSYTDLVRGAGASARVFQLLDRQPVERMALAEQGADSIFLASENAVAAEPPLVELRDVHFAYPTRPDVLVLNGFSVTASRGEVVAMVGTSGSGKSSCFMLLERFYDAVAGRVLVSGKDVSRWDQRELHSIIGMVAQEPLLFRGTISDNIAYAAKASTAAVTEPQRDFQKWWRTFTFRLGGAGHPEVEPLGLHGAPDARIEAAARVAHAHEFVSKLPRGYATEVGERGVQLSGGQRQRIAIARVVMLDPEVLLLDEATAALDTESEAIVQAALDAAMRARPRATLCIAHRLATVKDADKIVVMDHGEVIEVGRHEELLEKAGKYADLWRRQVE